MKLREDIRKFVARAKAKKIRLKVISDGIAATTHVIDIDTGLEVKGIVALSWQCDARNEPAVATIYLRMLPVEIEGVVEGTVL